MRISTGLLVLAGYTMQGEGEAMTARWVKKRRTVQETRAYLLARYADQAERFPRLRETGEARYVRVNMRAARTYCVQEVTP
jgi:hypothetical protein